MSATGGFIKEFREFAIKGNMMDLAIGVIIGGAFGKIIDSVVNDLFMPLINFIVGGNVNFDNLFWVLRLPEGYAGGLTMAELTKAGAVVFAWGHFLTIFVNFLLLALVVFVMVKLVNNARRRFEAEPPPKAAAAPPEDVLLLREIRDALKK
ncbi:large conductance mechanosensitive channel protein MscL [Castellaniella denitrificans]|jgi:large conductance mechanosensitive channel|uniref:Large-conductance mechanosensitive channel n=1 Tax=Castellaniella denitrificans TaxID=56119 RepID=A0ABT4M0G0_9BURK|nr:large conductance mechanosensitive channel protein MscL [Castellaniella denitrificans]MCZ4328806.1 large conductance mechanosensitive channel protein MscL [Castellaniella denitrificans]